MGTVFTVDVRTYFFFTSTSKAELKPKKKKKYHTYLSSLTSTLNPEYSRHK